MYSIDLPKLQTLCIGLAEAYSSCFYFASLQLRSMNMNLLFMDRFREFGVSIDW